MSSVNGSTMRRHLLWKECSQFLPIWLAFLGFLALSVGLCQFVDTIESRDKFTASMAMLVVCLFPMALGVFMFAPERENQTDQLLASFPVSSRLVSRIKFLLALASVVLFVGLTVGLLLLVMNDWRGTITGTGTAEQRESLWLYGLLPFSLLVCCAYASMRSRNSLVAALGGGGLLVILVWVSYLIPFAVLPDLNTYFNSIATVCFLAFFTVAVVSAMHQQSAQWLRNGEGSALSKGRMGLSWLTQFGSSENKRHGSKSLLVADEEPKHVYRSLFWHSMKSSLPMLVLATMILLAIVFTMASQPLGPGGVLHSQLTFMIMIVSGVFGSLTFYHDHRQHRFRFFQQNAEFPHKFWLTRILPGLFMTLLVSVICWGLAQSYLVGSNSDAIPHWMLSRMTFPNTLLFGLTIFSANHLASLYLRSGVFLTLACWGVTIATACYLLYLFWLDGRLHQFAWAIPVSMLLAGWARSKPWMAESPSRVQWLGPLLIAGLTTVLVSVVVILVRSDFGYLSSERLIEERKSFTQASSLVPRKIGQKSNPPPREQAGVLIQKALMTHVGLSDIPNLPADIDMSALGTVDEWPDEVLTAFVGANKNAIQHLTELAQHIDCVPVYGPNAQDDQRQSEILVQLSRANALFLEREGRLEDALKAHLGARRVWRFTNTQIDQRYHLAADLIRWSQHPNQDSATLKKAIQLHRQLFPWIGKIPGNLASFEARKFVGWFEKWLDGNAPNEDYLQQRGVFTQFLPWEVARSATVTVNEIYFFINRQNQATSAGRRGPRSVVEPSYRQPQYLFSKEVLRTSCFANRNTSDHWKVFDANCSEIQIHRFAHLRLAIAAWRLDHEGRLPVKLDELVPEYLIELPTDVFSGGDFCYLPNGLSKPAVWLTGSNLIRSNHVADESGVTWSIKENAPFLLPWDSSPRYIEFVDEDNAQAKQLDGFMLDGFGTFRNVSDWGGGFELLPVDGVPKTNEPENLVPKPKDPKSKVDEPGP